MRCIMLLVLHELGEHVAQPGSRKHRACRNKGHINVTPTGLLAATYYVTPAGFGSHTWRPRLLKMTLVGDTTPCA